MSAGRCISSVTCPGAPGRTHGTDGPPAEPSGRVREDYGAFFGSLRAAAGVAERREYG